MRTMVQLVCAHCGRPFERQLRFHKQSIANGSLPHCSVRCSRLKKPGEPGTISEEYVIALTRVYNKYREQLIYSILRIVKDRYDAEDVLAECLRKFVEHPVKARDMDGIRYMLFASVKNLALNSIVHKKPLSLSRGGGSPLRCSSRGRNVIGH